MVLELKYYAYLLYKTGRRLQWGTCFARIKQFWLVYIRQIYFLWTFSSYFCIGNAYNLWNNLKSCFKNLQHLVLQFKLLVHVHFESIKSSYTHTIHTVFHTILFINFFWCLHTKMKTYLCKNSTIQKLVKYKIYIIFKNNVSLNFIIFIALFYFLF